jgi:Rieske Fe-S protein
MKDLSLHFVQGDSPVQIGRREFVVRTSMGLSALLVAACQAGVDTAPLSGSVVVPVANHPALANVGGIVRISETNTPIALERTGASTFVAYSLVCPHEGGTVNVSSGSSIPFVCPVHGAQFNASGSNVGGQRTSSLHTYATVYDAATNSVTIS